MKTFAFATLMLLGAGLAQAGTVEVHFEQIDRYADAGRGAEAEANRALLARHLQTLGEQGLPAQQTLRITITDIDLAGRTHPEWPNAPDLRVLGGTVDWPRIALRYRLSEGEQVLREGEEQLSDMGYLMHPTLRDANERLPYERRLLSDWFRNRFAPGAGR